MVASPIFIWKVILHILYKNEQFFYCVNTHFIETLQVLYKV